MTGGWSAEAEVERLRGNLIAEGEDKARLAAEVERLRVHEAASAQFLAERDGLRKELEKVMAEVARLRAALEKLESYLDSFGSTTSAWPTEPNLVYASEIARAALAPAQPEEGKP